MKVDTNLTPTPLDFVKKIDELRLTVDIKH